MKSIKINIFTIIVILPLFTHAQILNGDFEEWSAGEPVFWFTSNDPLCSPGTINIFQTSKASSGNSAVYGKVIIATTSEECGGGSGEYSPSISSHDYEGSQLGFSILGRPKQMRINYIYKPIGEGGAFTSSVYLTKWDYSKGERVIVGSGGFMIFNTIFLDTTYTEHVSPMNYYFDEDPDTMLISFSLFSNDVGSEFYLDNVSLSFMQILNPSENDIVIAGEKDTIKWDAGSGKINIMYSLDDGNTYTTIENNYPADSSQYIWEVPSNLISAKAKIRIEDSEDNTQYDEKSVYIKPWQLTRVNANGDFELFEPSKNGWSFCNCENNVWPLSWWEQFNYFDGIDPNTGEKYPQREPFSSAISPDFPDWPVFVEAIGVNNSYIGTEYSSRATTLWDANSEAWGGSCEGYAVSSLLYFYHQDYMSLLFPGVGNLQNINSVSVNNDVRRVLNRYYIHQFTDPYWSYEGQRWNTVDARQTLQELKDMFSKNNKDAMPLGYYNNNGSGGHAVTPYKLERIGETSTFNLRVYDSNNPGATNRGIRIDSAANTWTDLTGLGWGTGTTGCVLGLRSREHVFNVHLPSNTNLYSPPPKSSSNLMKVSSSFNIYNTSNAEIIIENSEGNIGYTDSLITNTLANARPIIPKTGTNHPPIGYALPKSDYSILINNFEDSSSYVFFISDSTIYNFRRHDAISTQTDRLNFSDGLGIESFDESAKNIHLETIIEEENGEKVFVAENLIMSQDDSLHIKESERSKLEIKNYGIDKNYDLHVRSANQTEAQEFNHRNIALSNNSSHTLIPNWDNLESDPIKILIDIGNDGNFDDSIFVSNVATGINEFFTSTVPVEFKLHQNYPNPFNPSTKITYSIPTASFVTLKVYDMLGRDVKSLINEEQSQGNYEIEFDASMLSTGIYFYRLTAGDYVETKKMVLMK